MNTLRVEVTIMLKYSKIEQRFSTRAEAMLFLLEQKRNFGKDLSYEFKEIKDR